MQDSTTQNSEKVSPHLRGGLSQIDLFDLLRDVWGGRKLILLFLATAFFVSAIIVASSSPVYTSTMLVGPPERDGEQGLGSALGRAAGAASLFGVGLGSLNSTTFGKYSSVLESYELASRVLENDRVKGILFGPSWLPTERAWVRPTGLIFESKDWLKGVLGMARWTVPSAFTVHDKLKRMMVITPDKLKGYLSISMNANSPEDAQFLLNVVYKQADELLRRAAKERSKGRIQYLSQELKEVRLQDQRDAIINVLSSQEQKMMMASADTTVAIEIIDPPLADPTPTAPKPRAILLTYSIFALFFGALFAIIYGVKQRNKTHRAISAGIPASPLQTVDQAALRALALLFRRGIKR